MTKIVTSKRTSATSTGTHLKPKSNNVVIPNRLGEICSKDIVNVVVPKDVYAKIRQLCKTINLVEWSGPLFYKIEGDLTDIPNMTLTCLDILPLDKGSSAYTEYTMDEKVLEYMLDEMTEHPLEDIKIGHIHSHNSMSVFFSGTDKSELHDNAPNHNVYLSLIVNNKGDYDCRLAYIAKVSSVMTTQCLNVDGSEISFDTKYDTKEVLVWHNCNVIEEVTTEPVSDSYMELITTLDKSKPNYPQFYGRNYNRNVIGYGYGQSAIDYDSYEEDSYAKNYGASIKPDKKKTRNATGRNPSLHNRGGGTENSRGNFINRWYNRIYSLFN